MALGPLCVPNPTREISTSCVQHVHARAPSSQGAIGKNAHKERHCVVPARLNLNILNMPLPDVGAEETVIHDPLALRIVMHTRISLQVVFKERIPRLLLDQRQQYILLLRFHFATHVISVSYLHKGKVQKQLREEGKIFVPERSHTASPR